MNDQPTDYSSIDAFHVGRRRKPNFTEHEVLNIIDQYDTYKELLHSREASKSVIAQKQAIWKQITDNLNASYPQVERTVDDVRRKWKKLQSEAKREVASYRAAQASGSTSSLSNKQLNLYTRILTICRPAAMSSQFSHAVLPHQQQILPQQSMTNNNHDLSLNEQLSDKADSPSSDLANGVNGQLDSPGDESASLLGNDDNSRSPTNTLQPTSNMPSQHVNTSAIATLSNGQVSKRTLDKRRKLMKSSANQYNLMSASTTPSTSTKPYVQQHGSLRYESLLKRKRILELTSQKLLNDRQILMMEKKSIDIKLETNECENKRIGIEKRRLEIALQKYQSDSNLSTTNGNNNHFSDQDDHDDNDSLDDISDINE